MGAISITNTSSSVVNDLRQVRADIKFSSSYATGGDTVPLGQLGLTDIEAVFVSAGVLGPSSAQGPTKAFVPATHGVQVVLAGTHTAPLLKAIVGSTPAEVANTTNLSTGGFIRVEFRGH